MARDLRDAANVRIRGFEHYLAAQWQYHCDSEKSAGKNGELPKWKQVEQLKEKIDRHPANRNSTFHNPNCGQALKDEYKALKTKLEELQ